VYRGINAKYQRSVSNIGINRSCLAVLHSFVTIHYAASGGNHQYHNRQHHNGGAGNSLNAHGSSLRAYHQRARAASMKVAVSGEKRQWQRKWYQRNQAWRRQQRKRS